jgi:hypothetical protein
LLSCEENLKNDLGKTCFSMLNIFFSQKHHLCGISPSPRWNSPLPLKKVWCECLKEQIAIHVDNFIIVNNIHD